MKPVNLSLTQQGEQKKILKELFSAYRSMVGECLKSAISMNITSRKRLHGSIYGELRGKFRDCPSHYIYNIGFRNVQIV
jgi:hypothetical protein